MKQKKEYDIFISYRRFDSEGRTSGRDIARTLQKELTIRGYTVFFDYGEIKDEEFESVILPAVQSSKVFLLVLTKDTLLRCANEGDWVKREIEAAISSKCKIVPIDPDHAFSGWPESIPDSIRPITKQQISEISMESLFEKSIDKIEEERLANVFDDKATPYRLHSITFFLLYFILGFISCYYCAESLYLTLFFPKVMIWPIIIAFFFLLSYSVKIISEAFNPKKKLKHRTWSYLAGLALSILYGLLFLIPGQTHALYYRFSIVQELNTDLKVTKQYLQVIQKEGANDIIDEEIATIEDVERKVAYGVIRTSEKSDVQKADSVLLSGYNLIKNRPQVQFLNIDDEIRYMAEKPVTRIQPLMNVFSVWKIQLSSGFSIEFLFALLISFILSALSTFSFIKATREIFF